MRSAGRGLAPALVVALWAGAALAAPAQTGRDSKGRTVLQTPQGRTLYVYRNDPTGESQSTCTETCAKAWPPFTAPTGPDAADRAGGEWTIIARDDGSHQWAYKGRPLYTFYRDQKRGDANGIAFEGGAWEAASP